MKYLFALLSLSLMACASAPSRLYKLNLEGKVDQKTLERLLWENSMSNDKNVQASPILESDYANYYLVQVRVSEDPHLHERHDMVILMQTGRGIMHLKNESFAVSPGSIIFVPRRTPHYFVNTGPSPASALVIFSPGYYGNDYVPLDKDNKGIKQ